MKFLALAVCGLMVFPAWAQRPAHPIAGREVWVLSPTAQQQAWDSAQRARFGITTMEPTVDGWGNVGWKRVTVNCAEPSVSIQYTDDRNRLYADTYVYDFGWSDVSTVPSPFRRSLSFDLEPSYSDLNAYVQRVCPVLPSP